MKKKLHDHPDQNSRKLIAISCAGMAQHGIILLLLGPVLPEIMKTFQITESIAGIMLGIGSLGFLFAPIIAGSVIDRYGVRRVLFTGLLIETALLLVFGFSPFLIWAIIAIFLLQFGAGCIEISLNVIPSLVRRREPGSLMNLVHLFFGIGALLSPFMAGIILQYIGNWRFVFWFTALPTVILLFPVWKIPFSVPVVSREKAIFAGGVMRDILRNRSILIGALVLFLYVGAEVGVSSWIVLYLQQQLGFSTLISTSGLSILWIGITVGRYLNSLLARRLSSRELVLGAGIAGLISGLLLLAARTPLAAYICLGGFGLALSGVFPGVMAELNSRDLARSGRITAVLSVAASLGAAVIQPVFGGVVVWLGWQAAMAVPAILMALSGAVYWLGVEN